MEKLKGEARTAHLLEDSYPLSPIQQGMLFHSLYDQQPGVYVQQWICGLQEDLNLEAFKSAWQRVVERHPILRTSFRWKGLDEPCQEVHRHVALPWEEQDWRGLSAREQATRLEDYLRRDRQRGFELTAAPLLRLALFRVAEAGYQFVWTSHHALLDGRSRFIVLREFFALYEAFCQGRDLHLTHPRPYRDHIAWLQRQNLSRAEAFWRQTLAGFSAPTPLVGARPLGGALDSEEGYGRQTAALSAATTSAVRSLAQRYGLTVNTLVQGAWALLLSRYSGEEDVVFGAVRACRRSGIEGAESMVGVFINTLPVRARLDPEMPLLAWLQALRAQWLAMREHEHTPLVRVQDWSEVPRDLPLFESVLVFENYQLESALRMQDESRENRKSYLLEQPNYPLVLGGYLDKPDGVLRLKIDYDRLRFDDATVGQMVRHVQTLLEGMAADPEQRLADVPLLTEAERHKLLVEWNDTHAEYPHDRCIHQLFEEQVERTPNAVAVVFEKQQLTYRELNERANQLAHALGELGVGPNTPVGVCLERSPEMIVALLGVLKAGGAYVPLDPTYPAARLKFMLDDTSAPVLLTQEATRPALPAHDVRALCLDADRTRIDRTSTENPSSGAKAEDLAYVIYTSGSTGTPKGVCVPHRAVNRLVISTDYAQLTSDDVVAQASNASFDAATWEIWGALLNGARLVVLPRDTVLSPRALATAIKQQQISALFLTTALFNQVARENPAAFRPLRHLLFGGEAVKPRWVREVLAEGAPERLLHVYGPTETTTYATWHLVQEVEDDATTIPIGRPIANTEAYVLDAHQHPVPVGVPGELYIGGPGVAHGYLDRPELTAERFVLDPIGDEPEARLYKTGDRVRRQADGNIEYLGRFDHQVKIRGFRVEPGEIEGVLNGHNGVRESAVVLREDAPEQKRLVAYVVPVDAAPSHSELRAFLRQRLPDYMVPSAFVVLGALPLTPSGKVARRALPSPEIGQPDPGARPAAPRDALEERLAGIWEEVLEVPVVGMDDDFFELGGHSLLAVSLFARIEEAFGWWLPLATLFQAPTVGQLADVLRREREEVPRESVVALQPRGSHPPFFCVHGGGGHVFIFRALAQHMGPDQPFYGIQIQEQHRVQAASLKIEAMAASYIRELRKVQPEGPYFLGGFSFGGIVAFEMAQQLHAQGRDVALLVVLDTSRPNYLKASLRARLRFQTYILRRKGPSRYLQRTWSHLQRGFWRAAFESSLRFGYPPPHAFRSEYLLRQHARRAVGSYEVRPYPGRITLFRGTRSKSYWLYPDEPYLGWDSVAAGGVEVHELPGNHGTFFNRPHLATATAARLKSCLEQARTRSSP